MGLSIVSVVNYSLNEIDAQCRKAARGGGYPWGLAAEAGRAVRWLCQHDIDGCAQLVTLLDHIEQIAEPPWVFPGQPQQSAEAGLAAISHISCPIMAGACLSDHSSLITLPIELSMTILQPWLLTYFVAHVAQRHDTPIRLTWADNFAATNGTQLVVKSASQSCSTSTHPQTIRLQAIDTFENPNKIQQRAFPSTAIWNTLERYASRTYAPATEESRRKGAGADE